MSLTLHDTPQGLERFAQQNRAYKPVIEATLALIQRRVASICDIVSIQVFTEPYNLFTYTRSEVLMLLDECFFQSSISYGGVYTIANWRTLMKLQSTFGLVTDWLSMIDSQTENILWERLIDTEAMLARVLGNNSLSDTHFVFWFPWMEPYLNPSAQWDLRR